MQQDTVTVRPEKPADEVLVDEINLSAFSNAGEARLVRTLRGGEGVLSLVAERQGKVVGHILFTPVRIGNSRPNLLVVGLGPMAVDPDQQGTGIGTAMVEQGLAACRAEGVDAVFVMGHRSYYPRFGFTSAPAKELRFRGPQFDANFFVVELNEDAIDGLEGLVAYAPEFDDL